MRRANRRHGNGLRLGAAVLCVGVLTAGTYAVTASNTVPGTNAGDGQGIVSGYTVSNVQYNAQALDPTLLDTYTFDLNESARVVKAKPVSTQAAFDSCTASGNTWTCTAAANTTIQSLDQLRVIAMD
jgi:hypothetical protein